MAARTGASGAILSIETASDRTREQYLAIVERVGAFSHLTIEIARVGGRPGDEMRDVA